LISCLLYNPISGCDVAVKPPWLIFYPNPCILNECDLYDESGAIK